MTLKITSLSLASLDLYRLISTFLGVLENVCDCRDREPLVSLEAIRCIFGSRSRTPSSPSEEARAVKLRIRAWLLLSSIVSTYHHLFYPLLFGGPDIDVGP